MYTNETKKLLSSLDIHIHNLFLKINKQIISLSNTSIVFILHTVLVPISLYKLLEAKLIQVYSHITV